MEVREDHRRHPRHACDRILDGTRKAEEGERTFACHVRNASEGGMMLETRETLSVGQRLSLSLVSRDGTRSVLADAEVIWMKPYGEVFRCGVAFLARQETYVV